jgi:hypothetical protein
VPRFTDLSYGIPVALQVVRDQHGVLQGSGSETLVHLLAALAAVGAGAALALARGRRNPVQRSERETFDVDALWVGACVFVGSFLTIGNWNYRLVFLVLVVPALLRWRHRPAPLPFATAALGVLVASLWLSAPVPVVPLGPSGVVPLWDAFAWDELLYWLLAAYLVAALSVTTALTGEKRAIRGAA